MKIVLSGDTNYNHSCFSITMLSEPTCDGLEAKEEGLRFDAVNLLKYTSLTFSWTILF